jgi:TRAP transporter TAXI family solute receptor
LSVLWIEKEVSVMTRKSPLTLLAVIAVVFLCLGTLSPLASASEAKKPKFITISSYPIGSLGTVLATAFSNAIEKQTGVRSRPLPADTDVGRVMPVKVGEAQLGVFTAATLHFAGQGLGEFSAPTWGPQRLRFVFGGNVIPHGMPVRVDSGIKTWADLKGKRVSYPPGLFSLTVPAFLAYGNLTKEDVTLVRAAGYTAGIKMVMDGSSDACHSTPISPVMKEWEAAPYGLRWLPMSDKDTAAWDRVRKVAPFMASATFADYGALGEGGEKGKWFAYYPYTLSAYDTTDEHTIYLAVKALVDGRDLYKDVKKPASEQWTLKDTLNLKKPVYVPFHPGTIAYAKEMGEWTAEHQAWQEKALQAEEDRIAAWKAKK